MLAAIDVGYSHTKAATDGRRPIFPTVLGEVQQAHVTLDLATVEGIYQIETADGTWFFGETALEQSGMQTRRQDPGWIETPEYKALVLAAITELSAGSLSVELVTGLPIADFRDRHKLVKQLRGTHQVRRAGRKRAQQVTVSDVLVLPQGMAAVLSEALDDKGRVRTGPIATGMVGLLDIGGHTVNASTFKELREIARQTTSIEAGAWGPLNDIARRINNAYPGLGLKGHAIIEAVKAGQIRYYGETRDIRDIANATLRPFARRIIAEASQIWGSAATLDVLLIAGGGAELIGPTIAAEYPHARVVDNPQWANTEGYLKFGRRHFGGS